MGNFAPLGSQVGTIQDLNGDGFMDIGSTAATVSTSVADNWFPRYFNTPDFATEGTPIENGTEFALFSFTYTALTTASGSASIQWTQQHIVGLINSAIYEVDGVVITSKDIGSPVGATGTSVGAPVVIVPEPSAVGMALLGALSMGGFRRFGSRRTA
jgi:hypothetical protein